MDVLDEAGMLVRLARWGLALARYDMRAPSPVPDNPKFMTPRAAVGLIRDGAVVAASGLGAHQRASILYWALREEFAATRHPRSGETNGMADGRDSKEQSEFREYCRRMLAS